MEMRLRSVAGLLLTVTSIALVACSDDESGTGDDGAALDDGQQLTTLTDAQLGALCDWSNAQQGGYGKSTQCPDGSTIETQKDQATCKAEDGPTLMKCQQTVGAYKACTLKLAASPCDITGALVSKECQPLLPCLAGT